MILSTIFLSFLFVLQNADGESTRLRLADLIKFGDRQMTQVFHPMPPSGMFINHEIVASKPAKFSNYSEELASFFDVWRSEKSVSLYSLNALAFGDIKEYAKNEVIERTTSLKKFLTEKKQFSLETTAEFSVPLLMRKDLIMPSILDCDFMHKKLQDVVSCSLFFF